MTNLDLVKEDYKVDDAIRITWELGVKEGTIIDFLGGRIKLHPFSGGKPLYIKEENIGDWEEGFLDVATESMPQNIEILVIIESQTSQKNQKQGWGMEVCLKRFYQIMDIACPMPKCFRRWRNIIKE